MKNIFGFYRFPQESNNNPNMVATFGELNTFTLTYTLDDFTFHYSEYPKVDLVTLRVADPSGNTITPPEAVAKKITAVGDWIYDQYNRGTIPDNTLHDQFYTNLRVEFSDFDWVSMGEIVQSKETNRSMPTHVEFVLTDNDEEYQVKVWLANDALQKEYEPFIIHIIPPIENIDNFDTNASMVASLLHQQTTKVLLNKYNAIRADNPDTRFDTYELTWHDPEEQTTTLNTQWAYVAYGQNATNIDNIKNAIRDYIAANSKTKNWLKIFPSLYDENDFTILPLWDRIAVPETNLDQNLYASISALKDVTDLAKKLTPSSYGSTANIESHIQNHLEVFATYYRGMLVLSLGNPANLKQTHRLSKLYPEYSSVAPSSDFERMDEVTREFAEKLNIGLEHARVFKKNDTPSAGFYRVIRNNKVYLAFLMNNFQYLIITRESYMLNKGK